MNVLRSALCLTASLAAVGCFVDLDGDKRPPPAQGGDDTHIGAAGETSLCPNGTTETPPLPDLGSIELVGDGERLKLNSAPSDPSYTATYPLGGLSRMTVRIDGTTSIVPTCVSKAGATIPCGDHPFYARLSGSMVNIFDVYGKLIFKAEVPPQPKKECKLPEGGTTPMACPEKTNVRAEFCSDLMQEVSITIDCKQLDAPDQPPINIPANAQKAACMTIVSKPAVKASSALAGCDGGSTIVSTWTSAARIQMLNAGVCSGSPLVLDLDGSGLAFGTPEDGVSFDLFGGGSKVKTAWPKGNVAFLALDRNHDGAIEGAELFGSATDNGAWNDGFEALRALDVNGDLVIDRRDPVFAELVLWTAQGELHSLAAHGIESFDLNATRIAHPSSLDSNGNSIPLLSSYRTKDGKTRAFADVFLRFKP